MEQQAALGSAGPKQAIPTKSTGRTVLSVLGTMAAALGIAAAVAGVGYLGLCLYAAHGNTIWPGISVLGQDLGGLTVEQAAARLDSLIENASLDIYLYDHVAEPAPREDRAPDYSLTFADFGFHPDMHSVAQKAFDMNITDPEFHTLGWRFLTGEGETEYHPVFRLDAEQEQLRSSEAAQALSFPTTDTVYSVDDTTLTVTLPTDGRAVYAADIVEKLDHILENSPDFTMDIPYTVLEHNVVTAQEIHDEVFLPTLNAYYDKSSRSVAPGQIGRDFDVSTVQSAMDAAAPGSTIQMSVTREYPAIDSEHLKAVLFRDVLGSASTHVSGSAARISNVRLAASSINGAVLNAGEVFSYNKTVGQRTAAKGYKEAPAYVQGQTVNEIGGGVCQPSSTLYLATLRSNLQITERYAHRYIPAYIPAGMDATVSWGGPDYKFTNNTSYPIKIQTSYNSSTSYLTVTLIGTKTDSTRVEITNEKLSQTDWKTTYQTDRSLSPGTQKVSVTPYTGSKWNTYRNIYDGNGNLLSSKLEAVSDYKVRDQVILRNPG